MTMPFICTHAFIQGMLKKVILKIKIVLRQLKKFKSPKKNIKFGFYLKKRIFIKS